MSSNVVTIEQKALSEANALLTKYCEHFDDKTAARLSVLESVSCKCSGIDIASYEKETGYSRVAGIDNAVIGSILSAIEGSGIPVALALSSLARIEKPEIDTKRNGSVYTDFRLASFAASIAMPKYTGGPIIDPSCGSSIVLAACAIYIEEEAGDASEFVENCVYGVDLCPDAIRGSIIALSTFVKDKTQLRHLVSHFICSDSLILGDGLPKKLGVDSFALVIGNPPWERVRPSRNEFTRETGESITYGEDINNLSPEYNNHRDKSLAYAANLAQKYNLKGGVDLYRAFLNLSISICKSGGAVALYLPAGIIRSKSMAELREMLLDKFGYIGFSIFMNRAKFFSIDTRFKFVFAMLGNKDPRKSVNKVSLSYCSANNESVHIDSELEMEKNLFSDRSKALGAPEIKTTREAHVLKQIWLASDRMCEHDLFRNVRPVRELDMTLHRNLFKDASKVSRSNDDLPLVEGRMVAQYRCGCKEYVSGKGRSAKWKTITCGKTSIKPQFFVNSTALNSDLAQRVQHKRIGFCDIAGQTNERAMQASFVPAKCICGNKVPTLLFEDPRSAKLWLGIVNTFAFDWVIRRYITTTINYFILENMPFPRMEHKAALIDSIIEYVDAISELENCEAAWNEKAYTQYAFNRAKLEVCVLEAYGLSIEDLNTIADDFPLVDQAAQYANGGNQPTFEIIRTCINDDGDLRQTVSSYCGNGFMPFLPNEYIRAIKQHDGK